MNKKQYMTPLSTVVEMENLDMIAESNGLGVNDEMGNGNQLVKGVELPTGPEGKDVVNRSLWDNEW